MNSTSSRQPALGWGSSRAGPERPSPACLNSVPRRSPRALLTAVVFRTTNCDSIVRGQDLIIYHTYLIARGWLQEQRDRLFSNAETRAYSMSTAMPLSTTDRWKRENGINGHYLLLLSPKALLAGPGLTRPAGSMVTALSQTMARKNVFHPIVQDFLSLSRFSLAFKTRDVGQLSRHTLKLQGVSE
nr:hypothetical protein CFP56_67373 [Quercus suber]